MTPMSPRLACQLAVMDNACDPSRDGWRIALSRAPSTEQRQALEMRQAELDARLAPASPRDVKLEIAGLLCVMAAKSQSDDEARALLEIYASDLAGLPMFAIAAACQAFRRGEIGDGTWAPKPGRLRQVAVGYARQSIEERTRVRKVLTAIVVDDSPPDPARKAAALALARKVMGEMQVHDPAPMARRGRRFSPEVGGVQDLTRLAQEAATTPPPSLSDEARAIFAGAREGARQGASA